MSRSATSFMLRKGQDQPESNINHVALLLMYSSIMKKGPWVAHITLCSDRGGGRADICNILPRKSTHVYIFTTYNRILHTNTPAQYRLNLI